MCKVISVSNQKGGIGKSSVVANLGIGLARSGKKIGTFVKHNDHDVNCE